MIDKYMTVLQFNMIRIPNNYFVEHRHSYKVFGAFVISPLSIAATGILDYIKLPLAAIEELGKGIFLSPLAPFSNEYSARCITHLKNSKDYVVCTIIKLAFGWLGDLQTMYHALKHPLSIPFYAPPSFMGSGLIYLSQYQRPSQREIEHPSICEKTWQA